MPGQVGVFFLLPVQVELRPKPEENQGILQGDEQEVFGIGAGAVGGVAKEHQTRPEGGIPEVAHGGEGH